MTKVEIGVAEYVKLVLSFLYHMLKTVCFYLLREVLSIFSINQQMRSNDIESYRNRTGDQDAIGRKRTREVYENRRYKNKRKVWADYENMFMIALGSDLD